MISYQFPFHAIAILLLSGCAAFDAPKAWMPGPDDWKPSFILFSFKDDVSKDCTNGIPAGRSAGGCTRYFGDGSASFSTAVVQRSQDRMKTFCWAVHELRHGLLKDEHGFGDSSCGTEGLR